MQEIDPELVEAMEQRPFPAPPSGGFESFREARAANLRKLRHLMPVPGPIRDQVIEEEHTVPARDGYDIPVRSYCPAKETTPGPLIVLFHEGRFSMGDLSDEEFNARLFTRDLGATCLNVQYRLAPEHPFPTGVNDCWDVLQWAARSASSLGANPAKGFIVGGSSAGGNISAVLAHLSRDNHLEPSVTGQWLSVPYLIPSGRVPERYKLEYTSMANCTNDPILQVFDDMDITTEGSLMNILKANHDSLLFSVVSPDLYPPTSENQMDKRPLAKAYFQVAGLDPLRDHSLVYDRILREEYGVETKLDMYPGFGHMFWTNWPEMKTSKKFAQDTLEGMKWLLKDLEQGS